jgi:hypothetical protein
MPERCESGTRDAALALADTTEPSELCGRNGCAEEYWLWLWLSSGCDSSGSGVRACSLLIVAVELGMPSGV